ncbi:MAG: hypothetical protein R3E87_14940 [Burkholderiaceae bacterium]
MAKAKAHTWTHDGLAADLAAHLAGAIPGSAIWLDMQLGSSGSPRPDVYMIPVTFQRFVPQAFEIKVSPADFRADVTAGKWLKYLKFAAGVTFAAPKGVIGLQDVPAGCGLILRGDDGWRYSRRPTFKHMDNLPRDAMIKLLTDGIRRERLAASRRERADRQNSFLLRRRIAAEVQELLIDRESAIAESERIRQIARNDAERRRQSRARETARFRDRMQIREERGSEIWMKLCEALGVPLDTDPHILRSRINQITLPAQEAAKMALSSARYAQGQMKLLINALAELAQVTEDE